MKKVIDFIKESRTEMLENVTWSKTSELQEHTLLVLVGTLVFALAIGAIDFVFDKGLSAFYDSF
jgi:preprotein translocase subunit SecE